MPQLCAVGQPLIPSHSVVDSAEEREHYWQKMLDAWGIHGPRRRQSFAARFPGANPCSVGRKDLAALHSARHVLALKSDGVRHALFLTLRPDGTPVALLIDRAHHMFEVEVLAPEPYFRAGTLLEGELVWRMPDERSMLLLIFDAVRIKGESLLGRPFEERLAAAEQCTRWSEELATLSETDIETRVAETDSVALVHFDPPLTMRPKRFVDRKHAARVWAERGDADHRVDGLILHKCNAAYVYGTATGAVLKWKPDSTVDLAGPPAALRCGDGPLGPRIGSRTVVVRDDSRVVTETDEDVLEYHVAVAGDVVSLFAMRKRPDKCTANSMRVIAATVQDVVDAVRVEEL